MQRTFKLERIREGMAPAAGETLGHALKMATDLYCQAAKDNGIVIQSWGPAAASMYMLAADAFDAARAASNGHSRRAMYDEIATDCRERAKDMVA